MTLKLHPPVHQNVRFHYPNSAELQIQRSIRVCVGQIFIILLDMTRERERERESTDFRCMLSKGILSGLALIACWRRTLFSASVLVSFS